MLTDRLMSKTRLPRSGSVETYIRYYRITSDTTVSISRNPSFLTKEVRSESSESDDRRPTKNTLNNRKITEFIRSDLFVVSSRIFTTSDRIRPWEIHLGSPSPKKLDRFIEWVIPIWHPLVWTSMVDKCLILKSVFNADSEKYSLNVTSYNTTSKSQFHDRGCFFRFLKPSQYFEYFSMKKEF
jgi:hypothetical protein